MTTLTTLTLLNILERDIDEISDHIDKLPKSVLIKLGGKCNQIINNINKKLVAKVNNYITNNKDRWNSMGPDNHILRGLSSYNKISFDLFLNMKDMPLLCVRFYNNGTVGIRKHKDRKFEYDIHDTYLPEILIKKYPAPWITDFCEYLGTVYSEFLISY